MAEAILLANAAATLFMTGVIWFVQVVHYPLFDGVGAEGYIDYQARHVKTTSFVVLPAMMVEMVTAIAIVAVPLPGVASWLGWTGLLLLGAVWAVTFGLSVPCHRKLEKGFDVAVHRSLVASNRARTLCWSLRAGLVLYMLWQVMR